MCKQYSQKPHALPVKGCLDTSCYKAHFVEFIFTKFLTFKMPFLYRMLNLKWFSQKILSNRLPATFQMKLENNTFLKTLVPLLGNSPEPPRSLVWAQHSYVGWLLHGKFLFLSPRKSDHIWSHIWKKKIIKQHIVLIHKNLKIPAQIKTLQHLGGFTFEQVPSICPIPREQLRNGLSSDSKDFCCFVCSYREGIW